jgi:hypothetical protein
MRLKESTETLLDGSLFCLLGVTSGSAFMTVVATNSGVCWSLSLDMVPQYNPAGWERPKSPDAGVLMVRILGLLKVWAAKVFAHLPFKDRAWTKLQTLGAILTAFIVVWRTMLSIKDNYDFVQFAFHEIGVLLDAIPSLPHVPSFRPLLLGIEWLFLSPMGPLVIAILGVLLMLFGGSEQRQTVVLAPTSAPPWLPPRRRNVPNRAIFAVLS